MIAKGYSFDIISDIGSGINYNKKGLNELIDLITSYKVEKIVILCLRHRLRKDPLESIDSGDKVKKTFEDIFFS